MATSTTVFDVTPLQRDRPSLQLEVVHVLEGWRQSICPKGMYKIGDRVVYIENGKFDRFVPSLLTRDIEPREFDGEVSEGVLLPMSYLGGCAPMEDGVDVSSRIGFKEHQHLVDLREFMAKHHGKRMIVSAADPLVKLRVGVLPPAERSYLGLTRIVDQRQAMRGDFIGMSSVFIHVQLEEDSSESVTLPYMMPSNEHCTYLPQSQQQ